MICYHESLNEDEVLAVNDYWGFVHGSCDQFNYNIKDVQSLYRGRSIRSVSKIAGLCGFVGSDHVFSCPSCKSKKPVYGRQKYLRRLKGYEPELCLECVEKKQKEVIFEAQEVLKRFKEKHFQPSDYLAKLSIEESLALLSILPNMGNKGLYIGESAERINITGCEVVDRKILISLLEKSAVSLINDIPPEVEEANRRMFGLSKCFSYDRSSERATSYMHPDSVAPGFYVRPPVFNAVVSGSEISHIVYQNMQALSLSLKEVGNIYSIIKEIQVDKMYKMTMEISREYKIIIENSNSLRALLYNLAENYAPSYIYFTFKAKAKDVILYMHKEDSPSYIRGSLFAKFVGDYIQYIEKRGWSLKKSWSLPPTIQTSPFEALFSQIYLDGHFDWSGLPAKNILALWLQNARLSEEAQDGLADESNQNSMHK